MVAINLGDRFDSVKLFDEPGCPHSESLKQIMKNSLSEFDGRILDEALVKRINDRLISLMKINKEIT